MIIEQHQSARHGWKLLHSEFIRPRADINYCKINQELKQVHLQRAIKAKMDQNNWSKLQIIAWGAVIVPQM